MDTQLFIPEKIKVGYQNRSDTYTKKLAYVIYYDMNGVLRKEKSWNSWCDKKIDPNEFNNEPTEGFVLNRKVGGYKSHWNFRDAHVRVYDPRDFEFEISVPNLLYILSACDCSRGKGLEGKFVYAWDGTELVLLPSESAEYKASQSYTILQNKTIKAKELVPGSSYLTKRQETLTYVGRYDYYEHPAKSKKYVFWDGKGFLYTNDVKALAATIQQDIVPNLAELIDLYHKSIYGSKVIGLFTKNNAKFGGGKIWFYDYEKDGVVVYVECRPYYYSQKNDRYDTSHKYSFNDGKLIITNHRAMSLRPDSDEYKRHGFNYNWQNSSYSKEEWHDPTNKTLWAKLESGATYPFSYGSLVATATNDFEDEGD